MSRYFTYVVADMNIFYLQLPNLLSNAMYKENVIEKKEMIQVIVIQCLCFISSDTVKFYIWACFLPEAAEVSDKSVIAQTALPFH